MWDEVFGLWKIKFLLMMVMNVMFFMFIYVKFFYKLWLLIIIFSYVGFENGFYDWFNKEKNI